VKARAKIKVSIVIPCHNAEKYIQQCLDSVVRQTLKEIEIIIVNDGSTDETLALVRKSASKNNRILVIDKKNGGYGKAVNAGIAKASGAYIGIVESDDFIAPNMYETLYNLTTDDAVDIVKGNFWDYYARPGEAPEAIVNNERANMPDVESPFTIREQPEILWGHPSVWSALYRREFLLENNIVFKEAKGGGWVDNPFFFETLCKAKSVRWTKEPLYYYRKTNEESSSKKFMDSTLPFVRMMDNLDVVEQNGFTDETTLRFLYARALMYTRGALIECDYDYEYEKIDACAQELMQRLKPDLLMRDFNLHDQYDYLKFASPLKTLSQAKAKILIFNWLPFDNEWNWGGGVTLYCKNIIEQLLKERPDVSIAFLSSGFAYDASKLKTFVRKIPNMHDNRVHQFEVVNPPIPAEQRWLFANPLVALENPELKAVLKEFIEKAGPFEAIHFQNIEGLSLDCLDLKTDFPQTKFVFSLHNYIPMCVTGFYFQRHRQQNCNPSHTGADCFKCTRIDIRRDVAAETYKRGLLGQDPAKCISQNRWIKHFGYERLDEDVSPDEILRFAQTATGKLNKNCDEILAVSKRTYNIAVDEGFDKSKLSISYIGTKVAGTQTKKASTKIPEKGEGLKIVFLGSDLNYAEKGFPWLLDTLEKLDQLSAAQIDVLLTCRTPEHAEIYAMLRNFRSVRVINGYTHDDLKGILSGCNLGIVPVLWEDNLPQIAVEMVAHGVPVLASSAGGASELCDSKLFMFKSGDPDDFLAKLTHFLEKPKDLDKYWKHHQGLVTLHEHLIELLERYGVAAADEPIALSRTELSFLIRENEFLHKHIALNENTFTPNPVLDDLRQKLRESEEQHEQLLAENRRLTDMENRSGRVTFLATYDSIQEQVGADLFKIELGRFAFADFYAEIKFIRLSNVRFSVSDILRISGTWHDETGTYELHLHQIEWEKDAPAVTEWIWFYIRENTLCFFAKYPEQYCSIAYDVLTLTTRNVHELPELKDLVSRNITRNEPRPKDAFNTIADYETLASLREIEQDEQNL